ncbi:MAG: DUF131 domain-containing protein [Thermoplasmatota archaeon]
MEHNIPLVLLLGGVACIIAGVATGEGQVGVFIIFPFVVGSGWLMLLGVILIFLSVVAFMFTRQAADAGQMPPGIGQARRHRETKAGGLILIGPIPIIISNDKTLAFVLLVIGIVVAVILWLLLPSF